MQAGSAGLPAENCPVLSSTQHLQQGESRGSESGRRADRVWGRSVHTEQHTVHSHYNSLAVVSFSWFLYSALSEFKVTMKLWRPDERSRRLRLMQLFQTDYHLIIPERCSAGFFSILHASQNLIITAQRKVSQLFHNACFWHLNFASLVLVRVQKIYIKRCCHATQSSKLILFFKIFFHFLKCKQDEMHDKFSADSFYFRLGLIKCIEIFLTVHNSSFILFYIICLDITNPPAK